MEHQPKSCRGSKNCFNMTSAVVCVAMLNPLTKRLRKTAIRAHRVLIFTVFGLLHDQPAHASRY